MAAAAASIKLKKINTAGAFTPTTDSTSFCPAERELSRTRSCRADKILSRTADKIFPGSIFLHTTKLGVRGIIMLSCSLATGLAFSSLARAPPATAVRMLADQPPPTYVTTAGGLKILDMIASSSAECAATARLGDVVTIQYSGELLSQASRSVGVGVPKQPWQVDPRTETFALGGGANEMWEEAVAGMQVGETRRVLVPPSATLRPMKKGRQLATPSPSDTIAFECKLCAVESGLLAFCVRIGLLGVGSFGPAFGIILLTNLLCYGLYGWSMMDPAVWLAPPPASATMATRPGCSPRRLMDIRAQLDLAVQASSVQAWAEAVDVVSDPLLEREGLLVALNACSSDRPAGGTGAENKDEIVGRIDDMSALLRRLSALQGSTPRDEDAMRAMSYGTAARSAFDAFLKSSGVDDPDLKGSLWTK